MAIKFENEAKEPLLNGVEKISKAVKSTLGARGRNGCFRDMNKNLVVTKDGVTIARNINLENKFEQAGASIIQEATKKVSSDSGDGTTTATTIAYEIIKNGMVSSEDYNPIFLKRGMDKALKYVIDMLDEKSIDVDNKEFLKNIASISANNEYSIGEIISDAIEKVGKDGLVSIKKGNQLKDKIEITDGIEVGSGIPNLHMITDRKNFKCEFDKPLYLIVDGEISSFKEISSIIENIMNMRKGNQLVLIAEKFSSDVMSSLNLNNQKNVFKSIALTAPGVGENRSEIIKDISAIVGAEVIDPSSISLEDVKLSQLGKSEKFVSMKSKSEIINGDINREYTDERIESLKNEIDNENDESNKEVLSARLAKLAGKIAVVSVGGESDIVIHERLARMTDALHSTRSAIESGVIKGGGITLFECYKEFNSSNIDYKNKDEFKGIEIVKESLISPLVTILENAGIDFNDINMKFYEDNVDGYDVNKMDFVESMIDEGIIDPTKVTKSALTQAVSIASTIITISSISL